MQSISIGQLCAGSTLPHNRFHSRTVFEAGFGRQHDQFVGLKATGDFDRFVVHQSSFNRLQLCMAAVNGEYLPFAIAAAEQRGARRCEYVFLFGGDDAATRIR